MKRVHVYVAVLGLLAGWTDWQIGGSATLPKLHTVTMVGNGFQPRELTIEKGDTVRFVLRSGGPHNAAFREIPSVAASRLRKVMKDTIADLSGPLLIIPGETYDVVFADVPAGKYPYVCVPHLAGNMTGTITVR